MHTFLGRLRAMLANGSSQDIRPDSMRTTGNIIDMPAAHYVISPEVLELVHDDKVRSTFAAMQKAGINQLPHDPILIEFRFIRNGLSCPSFALLTTKPVEPVADRGPYSTGDLYGYPLLAIPTPEGEFVVASSPPNSPNIINWLPPEEDSGAGFVVYAYKMAGDPEETLRETLAYVVVIGMACAYLMLNTKGIAEVRVCNDKLDRARAKAGKPRIGDYRYVKIGAVYDRSGKAHDRQGSGRHMPVHWRAGHVRNQRYGPAWGQTRPIFIQPVLVNFDPVDGGEPPLPHKEIAL